MEQLPIYYSDPNLTFLLAAISTQNDPPLSAYDAHGVAQVFGVSHASQLDRESLHLFSLFSIYPFLYQTDKYQEFLAVFLTTEARSSHSFLDNQRYSIAAQQCLQHLRKNCSFISRRISDGPILIQWALQCLPALLDRSSETEELIQSARSMDFCWGVEEYPAYASAAKAAIARYLSRCTQNLSTHFSL